MLKRTLCRLLFATVSLLPAGADVYIYNTTDERMNYQVVLPNGDTTSGPIEEYRGYYPTQTTLTTPEGRLTAFKVISESGNSSVEAKAAYSRCYLIGKKDGKLIFKPVSWSMDDGQNHKREMTLFNATGAPQTFDLVDEKQMRKITLQPGEETTVEAKYGFSGSSGFHHLKFSDGNRLDNAISSGYFVILYLDSRSPGKVQAGNYGHLTPPRNVVMK
ncbi:hypothetical protein IV102_26760 [bacterium]|nr:hypothetical protein [bacterium]